MMRLILRYMAIWCYLHVRASYTLASQWRVPGTSTAAQRLAKPRPLRKPQYRRIPLSNVRAPMPTNPLTLWNRSVIDLIVNT